MLEILHGEHSLVAGLLELELLYRAYDHGPIVATHHDDLELLTRRKAE
jgi:hypothetical protein